MRACAPSLLEDALAQAVAARSRAQCRTLGRLLTNDDTQARAARALGIRVLLPR